jgi:lipopolysaccharide export system permease protein
MRILDRERYWAFLKAYVICFVSLVGLYVVIDAFTNFDEFMEVSDGTLDMFRRMGWYYLIRLSPFYDRLCGVLTMMAAIFTITWMQRNNELLAMLAAGISAQRVIRPVVIGALVVSALAAINEEWIIPLIGGEELQKSIDDDGQRRVRISGREDVNEIVIHGKDGDRGSQTIEPVNVTMPVSLFGVPVELEAKQGQYISEKARSAPLRGGWLLRGVNITPPDNPQVTKSRVLISLTEEMLKQFPPPRGNPAAVTGPAYFLRTNLTFSAITHNRSWYQFAPTLELLRGLNDPANAPERTEIAVFLHCRIVRALLSLTLLLLCLPTVLSGESRNTFINLGLSLGTSAVFYAVCFVTQFLGNNSVVAPELSAWIPLIAFGTLAYARWDTIRT